MTRHKVLSIDFYDDFQCVGNNCEDHCCKDWSITVDKKTYVKYQKLPASEFKKKLSSHINRNRKANNDYGYGKINLVDKKCPMLSQDRLCEVYSNLGPENMCYTCRIYPRIFNKVDDTLETSLTVSCIEVARNLLLRENPIEFNLDIKEVPEFNLVRTVSTKNKKNITHEYFNEIREFAIGLIQNRRLTIENRLAVLGLFIKKLMESNDLDEKIQDIICNFNNLIECGQYDELIESLISEKGIDAQLEFLTQLNNIILSKRINNKRFIANFEKVSEGLHLESGEGNEIKTAFMDSLENSYRDFISKHQYIYENYLVCYMFKTMFPSSNKSIMETYLSLIVQFSILKMNMIGLCQYYKEEMDTDKTLNLIQSYASVTEHDEFLASKLQEFLKDKEYTSLAHGFTIMGK